MNIIILLLTFQWNISSKSLVEIEFTLNELISICEMSTSEFEDFALEKNYVYVGTKKGISLNHVEYKMPSRYAIRFYTKSDGQEANKIEYQTKSKESYMNLKESMAVYDYEFIESNSFENVMFHRYRNKKYQVTFYVSDPNQYYGYSVVIEKL